MPRTILVIDDSPTIRSIVKIYLMDQVTEVIEADGALRGLQLIRLMNVDLVIADVRMPGMDGVQFVEELRKSSEEKLKKLPVVLLTGDKSDGLKEKGLAAGATAFARKPVTAADLKAIVARILGT